jgi:hypothetical protein
MGEFKSGKLHSGSKEGPKVTSQKQATAIALSEARKAGAKIPVKKRTGGLMDEGVSTRPVDKSGRRITMQELEKANRDTGNMTPAQIKAARGAAARASRMQALEASESRLMNRPRDPRTPLIQRKEGGLSVMPRGKK